MNDPKSVNFLLACLGVLVRRAGGVIVIQEVDVEDLSQFELSYDYQTAENQIVIQESGSRVIAQDDRGERDMRLTCPECGAVASATAWVNDAKVRQFFNVALSMPWSMSSRCLQYIAMFRPYLASGNHAVKGGPA